MKNGEARVIGWVFVLVVAFVLAWLFTESKATRGIAFAVISIISVAIGTYFYIFNEPVGRQSEKLREPSQERQVAESERAAARSRFAIKTDEIAVLRRNLRNGVQVSWDGSGNRVEQPDLRSWIFSGAVENTSKEYTARDVSFEISIYSCPIYFDTPQEKASRQELQSACNLSGSQTVSFYGLGLGPGAQKEFEQKFSVNNLREPKNWRYWAQVSQVVTDVN
ncbi:MAG: hypothetical protein ACR2OJ_06720 [Hyphomicrobiales bacterium]